MPLSLESEEALLRRYHRDHRDRAARDELFSRYLGLALALARRFARAGHNAEDLEQVAALGLIKALDRYDPERGVAFRFYAAPTIVGELRRHLRDAEWTLRPSRGVQELAARVVSVSDDLTGELRRAPTAREIAAVIGCPPEDVIEARAAVADCQPVSLDVSAPGEGELPLAERIGVPDDRFAFVEDALALAPALASLPLRDRAVVLLRFEHELTQAEIARRMGVSQMHVSRILRRSLERIRVFAEAGAAAGAPVAA